MSDRKGPPPTRRGIEFDEAASGLQKALRRCDEEGALRFAVDLEQSGYEAYVWRRLFVITSEDVGLAEPHLPATIFALHAMAEHLRRKARPGQKPGNLMLVHAVLLIARAKKSRIVDHALIWASSEKEPPDVLDYVRDRHTRAGRKLGRAHEHFWEEAALLADRETGELSHAPHLEDPYRERARASAGAGFIDEPAREPVIPAQNSHMASGRLWEDR